MSNDYYSGTNEMQVSPYLSEKNLKAVLEYLFKVPIYSQKRINVYSGVFVVDYELLLPHNNQRMIVEFNGPTHYTNTATIVRDYKLRQHCKDNNIRLVEIPYFVQLTTRTVLQYFGLDIQEYIKKYQLKIDTDQPSGFLSKKIVMPYDFNCFGVERFLIDIMPCSHVMNATKEDESAEFWSTSKEIFTSLWGDRNETETELLQAFCEMLPAVTASISSLQYGLVEYPT
jgi:hypothetical protein